MTIESFPHILDHYFFAFLILHIILSVLISIVVALYIKKRFVTKGHEQEDEKRLQQLSNKTRLHRLLFYASLHKNNVKSAFLYFLVFNLSMPLLGYIASFWFAWQLVHVKYEKKTVKSNVLNLDEFSISFLEVKRIFGESSFNELIRSQDAPTQKKIYALTILAENLSPANLHIIKQTLTSKDDEVRLFGYTIINKAEKKLANRINTQLELFKNAKSKEETASAAYELAFLYWEMLYSELSDEILSEEFMQQVEHYLEIAIPLYTQFVEQETDEEKLDRLLFKLAKLHQLYGRYYLRLKEYENAITELTIAQQLNEENATMVLPYTAEAYFYLGKYHVVSSILNQLSLLEINQTIHPIIEQWKKASA